MVTPPLTDKLVYQTFRGIFVGEDSHLRKLKAVRKLIQKHYQKDIKVREFTVKYGLNSVGEVAKTLLEDQIFTSSAKARLRFPDLFEVAPVPINQPTTSVPKVTAGNVEVPKSVEKKSCEPVQATVETIPPVPEVPQQSYTQEKVATQMFDTVCLPLWDQHRILVRVQYALEKACFIFAQERLGGILQKEGWDCAEAVELNRWPKVLLTYQKECDLNSAQEVGKPLPSLLDSIVQLRHDAVHRARLTSNKLLERLADAVVLARLIQDDRCINLISTIRQKTQHAIEELVSDKALLNRKLGEIKTTFAEKRAELDRQEASLLDITVKEHREPMISVSGSLDLLYDGLVGGTDAIQALWRDGSDPTLSDDKSSESDTTYEPAKEKRKKAKKGKKATREGIKQQEEAEGRAIEEAKFNDEPTVRGELGDDTAEDVHKDIEIAEKLPVLPVLAPTVDSGSIEPALTSEKKGAEKDKEEDPLEAEHYFDCPEVVLDGCDSDMKHPLEDSPLESHAAVTDATNLTSEGRRKLEIAVTSDSTDTNALDDESISLSERSTSPGSTCLGHTDNNVEQGHRKSLVEEDISAGNGAMNIEASPEQPNATRGQSNALTVIKSWGEGQWPGSVCIKSLDDDPRLTSLPTANEKGRVTLVSMLEDIETAV
ncbi:unnamed protein product [Alternaria alternata]